MEPIWIGSPTDVRFNAAALEALAKHNDARLSKDGREILVVPEERWRQAQAFERTTWMEACRHAQSDRNSEHTKGFGYYRHLPFDLGDILEIGCGPFTQVLGMFAADGGLRQCKSITLLDPLLNDYLEHPNCTYKALLVHKLAMAAEDLDDTLRFDTVVCVNVLEHVKDAWSVLNKIKTVTKPGGTVVFHEKSWDVDLTKLYDVGHPIRLSEATVQDFLSGFDMLYQSSEPGDSYINHYNIMKRR